jgi:hypothetical protein
MASEVICVRPEKTLSSLFKEYHKDGEYFSTISKNVSKLSSLGFSRVIDVRGDGNCLIYSIIAYIHHTRDINTFVYTLLPFCNEGEIAQLISSPGTFLRNAVCMKHIADQVRDHILLEWDYKGDALYHMDTNAVDGLAREMTMRLLGVEEIVCYTLNPGPEDKECRISRVTPGKKDLRPDIVHKWVINLLSPSGYTHYNALLK